MNTAKQRHITFNKVIFFDRRSLDDFHKYKMSLGLYNGGKPVIQLCGCHDLHMADGEFVVKRNSDRFCGVFNSDWSPFKSRSFHKRTLSKHADIEIVNTTKVHIGGV